MAEPLWMNRINMDVSLKQKLDGNIMTTMAGTGITKGCDREGMDGLGAGGRKSPSSLLLAPLSSLSSSVSAGRERAPACGARWTGATMKVEMERKESERKETERKETEREEMERKQMERKESERKETNREKASSFVDVLKGKDCRKEGTVVGNKEDINRKKKVMKKRRNKEEMNGWCTDGGWSQIMKMATLLDVERETERKEKERKEMEREEKERKEIKRKETERKEIERKESERMEMERKDRMVEKEGKGDRMVDKEGKGDRMVEKEGKGDWMVEKEGKGDRMVDKEGKGDRMVEKEGKGDCMVEKEGKGEGCVLGTLDGSFMTRMDKGLRQEMERKEFMDGMDEGCVLGSTDGMDEGCVLGSTDGSLMMERKEIMEGMEMERKKEVKDEKMCDGPGGRGANTIIRDWANMMYRKRMEMERKEMERKETERKETLEVLRRRNIELAAQLYEAKEEIARLREQQLRKKTLGMSSSPRMKMERKETERKELERKEMERKEMERKESEGKENERKETDRKESAVASIAQSTMLGPVVSEGSNALPPSIGEDPPLLPLPQRVTRNFTARRGGDRMSPVMWAPPPMVSRGVETGTEVQFEAQDGITGLEMKWRLAGGRRRWRDRSIPPLPDIVLRGGGCEWREPPLPPLPHYGKNPPTMMGDHRKEGMAGDNREREVKKKEMERKEMERKKTERKETERKEFERMEMERKAIAGQIKGYSYAEALKSARQHFREALGNRKTCTRMAGVELPMTRPSLQCYRCWKYGHVQSMCHGLVDRHGACYKCGQSGHMAGTCHNRAYCAICHDAGLKAVHRMGGPHCGVHVRYQNIKNGGSKVDN